MPKVPSSVHWICIWIWIVGGNKDIFFSFFPLISYYHIECIRAHIHCLSLLGWDAVHMHNQIKRNGPHPHFETQCTWNKEPLILLAICWGKRRPVAAPFATLKLQCAFFVGCREPGSAVWVWISPSNAPDEVVWEFIDFSHLGVEWNLISK